MHKLSRLIHEVRDFSKKKKKKKIMGNILSFDLESVMYPLKIL